MHRKLRARFFRFFVKQNIIGSKSQSNSEIEQKKPQDPSAEDFLGSLENETLNTSMFCQILSITAEEVLKILRFFRKQNIRSPQNTVQFFQKQNTKNYQVLSFFLS